MRKIKEAGPESRIQILYFCQQIFRHILPVSQSKIQYLSYFWNKQVKAEMSSPAPASTSEAVSTLRTQLTALSTGGASHRELGEKYRSILDSVLTWKETDLVEGLKAFIEAIINENVSLVISRQV